MSDILDLVIGKEERAFLGGGNKSDILPKGPTKGKVLSWELNAEKGRVYLNLKTKDGSIVQSFGTSGKAFNFLLGVFESGGVKYAGKKLSASLDALKGKTVYFIYEPPQVDDNGRKLADSWPQVDFILKATYQRLTKGSSTSASWDKDDSKSSNDGDGDSGSGDSADDTDGDDGDDDPLSFM